MKRGIEWDFADRERSPFAITPPLLSFNCDTLFVVNFRTDCVKCIGRFDIQSDPFPTSHHYEDLPRRFQMDRVLIFDVVIRECVATFQLQSCVVKINALLVWRDSFLGFDLQLDNVNCVRSFNIQSDRFRRARLDEYCHVWPKIRRRNNTWWRGRARWTAPNTIRCQGWRLGKSRYLRNP